MEQIKNFIIKQVAKNNLSQDEAKKMLLELKGKQTKTEEDIAVIGISCRFPNARNKEEYWSNLMNGVTCIGDVPEKRKADIFNIYMNPHVRKTLIDIELSDEDIRQGNVEFVKGGYIDDVDKFDAGFFRIPPREAKFIDPVQRVFLEAAWEAIEDAGYGGKKIYGTKTGIYVGRDFTNTSIYKLVTEQDQMHLTGSWTGILATRLSYIFNFRGPGMIIDTACSSGAAAVHQACQALKNKECDYALAGGINVSIIAAVKGQSTNMEMVESGDSKVRTFDKNANGTVWGEGVGVLMLKPLSKALADKDNVYAVIKGSALNNDGASNGITAPNAEAQEEVITQAWKNAKVSPETISYIEAHGTGTVLGDPIEIKGLVNSFGRYTDRKQFCGIGSVKPSIGHLVAASGLASLIKVILSLNKRMIPASINFEEPNPYINFPETPIYVNDRIRYLNENDSPVRAGVSSFGFSGTNCHIVLEEAAKPETNSEDGKKLQVLTISARSEEALKEFAARYDDYFSSGTEYALEDVCYTSNTGRGHFNFRLAITADHIDELRRKISIINKNGLSDIKEDGIFFGQHTVVPNNKKSLNISEITENQKSSISFEALNLIDNSINNDNEYSFTIKKLCSLYIQGAEFEWDNLYNHKECKRVHVPTYPFEKIRYWADSREFEAAETIKTKKTVNGHPLFDDAGIASIDRVTFTTSFDIQEHWVLHDHKVMGNYVVPGTTYLEMARETSKAYYKDAAIELRDVIFMTPMVVGDEGKEAQTIVKRERDHLEFIVASKTEEDYSGEPIWTVHAEGKIYPEKNESVQDANIEDIKNKCNVDKIKFDMNDVKEKDSGFELGDRWNNIDVQYIGHNEALVYLVLPEKFKRDTEIFSLHPALMDNAVNAFSQSIGEGMYLPLSYKSLKIYEKLPDKFLSYIRMNNLESQTTETVTFDITIITEAGKVIADIKDYTIKKVHKAELRFKELSGKKLYFYDVTWVDKTDKIKQVPDKKGNMLILKSDKPICNAIADKMMGTGRKVFEVEQGSRYIKNGEHRYVVGNREEDYRSLLADIKKEGNIDTILHCFSLSDRVESENLSGVTQLKENGLYSLYYLTRALVEEGLTYDIRLMLLTENSSSVSGEESYINPNGKSLLGLGKVISQEYGKITCRAIDIDQSTDLELILGEALSDNTEYEVAFRSGKRYEPCISRINTADCPAQDIALSKNGVYLITGGAGGLGLEMAKHFAAKAPINLALIGRSELPEPDLWDDILSDGSNKKLCARIAAIREIENMGSKVIYKSMDISDENELTSFVEILRNKFGSINGIVHCAGVAGDGFIVRRSLEQFNQVIMPKIDGTWLLDKVTEKDNLEFFIMFSSMSTLYAGAGQGDYAAANSYMDAFADYRNRKGKRTLTINWPSWNETGMAVEYGVNDDYTLFKSLTTVQALNAFDDIIRYRLNSAYIGELNYKAIASLNGQLPMNLSHEIEDLIQKHMNKNTKGNIGEKATGTDNIIITGTGENGLSSLESKLAKIWAQVLCINQIDIYANFHDMGGDSILATQLLKEIEKEYPDTISISDIFSYPSVVLLSEYIDKKSGKFENDAEPSENNMTDEKLMNLLEGIESGEMSIENTLAMLTGQED